MRRRPPNLPVLAEVFRHSLSHHQSVEAALADVLAADSDHQFDVPAEPLSRAALMARRARVAACRQDARQIAREHDVLPGTLAGRDVSKAIARIRFEAYWRLSKKGHDLETIAVTLGRASHSTVVAGKRRFEKMLDDDPALRARLGDRIGTA